MAADIPRREKPSFPKLQNSETVPGRSSAVSLPYTSRGGVTYVVCGVLALNPHSLIDALPYMKQPERVSKRTEVCATKLHRYLDFGASNTKTNLVRHWGVGDIKKCSRDHPVRFPTCVKEGTNLKGKYSRLCLFFSALYLSTLGVNDQ